MFRFLSRLEARIQETPFPGASTMPPQECGKELSITPLFGLSITQLCAGGFSNQAHDLFAAPGVATQRLGTALAVFSLAGAATVMEHSQICKGEE